MRILLVNDHAPGPTGGAEVHVGRLRDALTEVGDVVELFVAAAEHRGIGRLLDLWDPVARRRLRDRVGAFKPDVVHYHNVLNELSTSVLGLGVPSVLTVHDQRLLGLRIGVDHGRSSHDVRALARDVKNRLATGRLRRHVAATIAPSSALAEALGAAGFPHVHHVANFAAVAPCTPPGNDVVFIGSLSAHKGPHVLLEAFVQVAERHPKARLRFVGDGPLRGSLSEAASASGLGSRIVLAGAVDTGAVQVELRGAALVVVPSLGAEGGPMAVIEGLCAGRPVIATDRPGVSEGVDDAVGAVVPAGDPDALAAAIDRMLGDRPGLLRRGSAARQRATARWSAGVVVPQVRSIYRSVARGGR